MAVALVVRSIGAEIAIPANTAGWQAPSPRYFRVIFPPRLNPIRAICEYLAAAKVIRVPRSPVSPL
jgi:hypothetical protein